MHFMSFFHSLLYEIYFLPSILAADLRSALRTMKFLVLLSKKPEYFLKNFWIEEKRELAMQM